MNICEASEVIICFKLGLLNSKGRDDEEYKKIVINKDYWILPVHSISEESIQKNCSGKHEKRNSDQLRTAQPR